MYAKLLNDMYGGVENSPRENVIAYNRLLSMEDEDRDKFIVRHRITRNPRQLESFEQKVLLELEDYANISLPLYPNATKDCEYMCPLQAACVAMDDGSDFEGILDTYSRPYIGGLTQREKEQSQWRHLLPEPNQVQMPQDQDEYNQLLNQLQSQEPTTELSPEEAFLEELG
jgi:hypothetical protein